jgi:hypothetical protein
LRGAIATLAIAFLAASSAWARIESGAGLDNEADRMMEIMCDDKVLGKLMIDHYYSWTSGPLNMGTITFTPENPGLPADDAMWANRGGAKMESSFNQTNAMLQCEFRWIQGVMSGTGTIGTPPYLDPFNRDDGLPYYWTETENTAANNGKMFQDIPSQNKANNGNSIHFEAAFVAVDQANMKVHYLKGFTWGYAIEAGGTVNLDNFAWRTTPTAALTGLVTAWDASATSPYAGNGTPDGWMWTDTCPCTMIPEPSSFILVVIGLTGLASRRRVGGKRAA